MFGSFSLSDLGLEYDDPDQKGSDQLTHLGAARSPSARSNGVARHLGLLLIHIAEWRRTSIVLIKNRDLSEFDSIVQRNVSLLRASYTKRMVIFLKLKS